MIIENELVIRHDSKSADKVKVICISVCSPFLALCKSLEPAPALFHHFCQVTFHQFSGQNALQAGAPERQDSQKYTSRDNHKSPI